MFAAEITSSWNQIGLVVISAIAMLAGIIALVRIVGLRSFSKMSSFDFAVTVAMGSVLASVALSGSSLVEGLVAAAALLGTQFLIAVARKRIGLDSVVDNAPLLLMVGDEFLDENLSRARVARNDVRARLREANVHNFDQVRYVVLETTGDVSVIHGEGELDPDIYADVIDGHRVQG